MCECVDVDVNVDVDVTVTVDDKLSYEKMEEKVAHENNSFTQMAQEEAIKVANV